jgi:integrase
MGLILTRQTEPSKGYCTPIFIYYKDGVKTKISTGVRCNINHWNIELKKVERGDKDYKFKNLKISSLKSKLESIINRFEVSDDYLNGDRLKLELQKSESVKIAKNISSLPLITLLSDWENDYINNDQIEESTKTKTKSVVKDIKEFVVKVQNDSHKILLIDDLNDDFSRNFMSYLFSRDHRIKTKGKVKKKGLQPHSVDRRFQYLQTFCKWYSKHSNEFKRIDSPRELGHSKRVSNQDDPIFLTDVELEKIINFKEFDFKKKVVLDNGVVEWVESSDYLKYLTKDRQNRSNMNGVLSFFSEITKYGKQTYTSYEVYKDLLVFLCSCGARFSDGINMKVGDFKHKKRNDLSPIEGGVEAFFIFSQKKTNYYATPRVNEVSFEIFKKYSRGKTKEDYLFPRSENGNPIFDTKFNQHIKKICKTIGLKRKVTVRKIGSKGLELEKQELELSQVISSHTGRKTFIKTLVLNSEFSTKEIMVQTGHKSEHIFHSYYRLKEDDLLLKPSSPFLKKRNTYLLPKEAEESEEIDVDLSLPIKTEKTLKEKLDELEEVKSLIGLKKYEEMKERILNNFM